MQRGAGSADAPPLAGLQLVAFRDVLENVVQDVHSGLLQLAERLPALGDEERKRQLLLHLQTTRQRLQRLHVCAQWAHKAKAVNTCREVLKAAQDHGAAFVHTADELFRLHEELRFCQAPLFDVSTALHITQTGTYRLLPRLIEDELQQPGQRLERPGELSEAQRAQRRRDALRRVDFLLRSKLLSTQLPAGMRVLRVRGGQATVAAAGGQFMAQLTLVPAPRDDVTLAKYRPPGEALEVAAVVKEEPEVTQQQPAAADGQPPSSAAAAAGPSASTAAEGAADKASQQREQQGPDCWRWQLLSFELLPAAAGHDPPPLLPAQRKWLQQHIEQRMWAAADVEQLARLGKQGWVTVPELPSAAKEQQQPQASAPSGGVVTSSHLAGRAGAAAAAAAGEDKGKGKQPLAEQDGVGQAAGEQQEQQPAAKQLPEFAMRPLAAMHGILCQTAGRLALFSLLLSDARQLEGSSWKGSLKLSRAGAGAGSGLRMSYWHQLPCASYAELQCLREGRSYQPGAGGAAGGAGTSGMPPGGGPAASQQQLAPAVEVALQEDGSLAASSSPQLCHALSGEEVALHLPLDRAASFSADRLLLCAAAHSAALQLASVQAVLQRSGRLAPAGVHAELSLAAGTAAVPAAAAEAGQEQPLPASPQLHLWCSGSLQLSLSMQLRTGRMLLLAGPSLLESEQGSDAAAAVAAVQQQLDQVQRDAMSQPLSPGSSRGMLAATLAAQVLARLSVQLSMRRRMDAAAAAAAVCGLQRATLPPQLLSQYLRQVALLLVPPSSNALTLSLPAFPPPPDMQCWARQQQQRRPGGGAVDSGATRCFLLLDFGEHSGASEAAEAAVGAAEGGGGEGAGAQQPANGAAALAQQGQQKQPRMLLAVCSCTARGTVTRVLQLADLPPHVLADAKAAAARAVAAPLCSMAAGRKRRASDAAAEAAAGVKEQADGHSAAAAAAAAAAVEGSPAELELGLEAVAAWCCRQAGWEALRSQLMMLPVQHYEEAPLGQPRLQVIRLPKAPSLAQLEAWAVAKLAAAAAGEAGSAAAAGPPRRPAASMQLDAQGEAGAWRVDLVSTYFANLPALLRQQGVRWAAPSADAQHIVAHDTGLVLRYSLAQGHSVLTAITDLVRLGMLHLCLTRLAGSMAANPLAAGAQTVSAGGSNGSLADAAAAAVGNACEGPTKGGLPNGDLQNGSSMHDTGGSNGSNGSTGLVWPLPGCGSVRLLEAGLSHLLLLVAPPPLPEGLQKLEQPPPLRVTINWDNTLRSGRDSSGGSSSGGSSGGRQSPTMPAALQRAGSTASAATAAASAAGPGSSAGSGPGVGVGTGGGAGSNGAAAAAATAGAASGGSLRHIKCRVACEPPLPEPVAAALAYQLEAGRVDLFLDSLCLAAHAAASAARQLTPEAQRAAGLLPGALRLLGTAVPGASAGGASVAGGSSALRLRAQLQQGGRAATLSLGFHAGGYTLLQLSPALSASAAAAASIWMPPLWDRLARSVPTFTAVEAAPAPAPGTAAEQLRTQHQQLRQAWVHHSGLAEAVAGVMRAVAATAAEAF